ncbi:MAG: general secretion pathway protein E, partial [Gammaproteobacteria bacterium]
MSLETELPYSFCKRFGVVAAISPDSGKMTLNLKNGVGPEAIIEAQRLIGMVEEIQFHSDLDFNRMLSQHFENNRETSFIEAGKIGGELNLDDIARELSEPEDLLESDDDAPIIRLINALITEAIKENASDIHVEPFESRLSIR